MIRHPILYTYVATLRISKQCMFPLWFLTLAQLIELLVMIENSLRACRSELARRRYCPDVTHAFIAHKIPVQLSTETHHFEKCS